MKMRIVALALALALCVAACGEHGTGGEAIRPVGLASVTHDSPRRAGLKTMMFLDGTLVEIDPADVYGDPEEGSRGLDPEGRLAPASGAWRQVPGDPTSRSDVIVLIDRDAPAAEVRVALAPLGDRCVGFFGQRDRRLAAMFPDPCLPPQDAVPGEVQLGVLATGTGFFVSASQINEREVVSNKAELAEKLRDYKTSAFFADHRKDLSIAFLKNATFGEVIAVLDVAHGAGFTVPSWGHAEQLFWFDSPARPARPASPPAGPTVSIGQPDVQGDLDKAIIRRYVKRNAAQIQTCYEKRLAARPRLAGTVTVRFLIDRSGQVSMSSSVGLDREVASCVAAVVKEIEFPRPKGDRDVSVSYPLVFRRAGK
ncbi:MAG TPA: AgmX/PglI C-terminal domain-containing protein [Kofleriaceae bacterium]|nr:AgmX/PglI C-terminal domain-containing protein [Kofleriaceae bacterium]